MNKLLDRVRAFIENKCLINKLVVSCKKKLNKRGDISITTIIIWVAVIGGASAVAILIDKKFEYFENLLKNIGH